MIRAMVQDQDGTKWYLTKVDGSHFKASIYSALKAADRVTAQNVHQIDNPEMRKLIQDWLDNDRDTGWAVSLGQGRKIPWTRRRGESPMKSGMSRLTAVVEQVESNIFSLYTGDKFPKVDQATAEIKVVADRVAKKIYGKKVDMDIFDTERELDNITSKWHTYGARDTASKEEIVFYIQKKARG